MIRWTRSGLPDDDIGNTIGYFGTVPWLLFALCTVEVGYLALMLGGAPAHTPLGIAALTAVLAAMLLIVTPAPTPLPAGRTLIILVVIVAVTAAITWQYTPPLGPTYYLSWELNPCDLLMFCLAIRGRVIAAWLGQAAMLATICIWSYEATGSATYGLSFSYTQPFPLIAVTVFAIGFERTTRQITAHRIAERERAEEEAASAARGLNIEAELGVVRELAVPLLEEISRRARPDIAHARSLEAELRDLIRGRNLAIEPLTSALRSARSDRGIEAVLLDDLGPRDLGPAERRTIAEWAAALVHDQPSGSLVLRLRDVNGVPTITLSVNGELRDEFSLRATELDKLAVQPDSPGSSTMRSVG